LIVASGGPSTSCWSTGRGSRWPLGLAPPTSTTTDHSSPWSAPSSQLVAGAAGRRGCRAGCMRTRALLPPGVAGGCGPGASSPGSPGVGSTRRSGWVGSGGSSSGPRRGGWGSGGCRFATSAARTCCSALLTRRRHRLPADPALRQVLKHAVSAFGEVVDLRQRQGGSDDVRVPTGDRWRLHGGAARWVRPVLGKCSAQSSEGVTTPGCVPGASRREGQTGGGCRFALA
jgi:hypothetical protein